MSYDAVVVGAGHNGLTAACYLGRAGLRVLVLERREVVGGAAVTEEIAPGFSVSTASYSLSLLRPDIYADLNLARHGLDFYPKDPQLFVPLPDGKHFFVWRDQSRSMKEIAKINRNDADAYRDWCAFWEEAVTLLRPMVESVNPPTLVEVEKELARRGREDVWRLAVAGSVADTVSAFFESEELRGAFATQGLIGTFAGPHDPGTAWIMAFHSLGGELNGATGTWAYVRGGMGGVTRALASAARESGAELRASAPVASVAVEGGRVVGVVLDGGEEIMSRAVVSGADPKTTFLRLVPSQVIPPELKRRAEEWRTDGCVLKVNAGLSTLPEFSALSGIGPQHLGTIEISPSIEYLDSAFQSASHRGYSSMPFMEAYIQSASDDSLAPAGSHVLSVFAQYIRPGPHQNWSLIKDSAFEAVIEVISAYAPNVRDSIVALDVLGPPELEERFGLWGGDIFHGSMLPGQSLGQRFGYRSGLDGLYLCGSGTHPGGGVMGASGRNAAATILKDLGRS